MKVMCYSVLLIFLLALAPVALHAERLAFQDDFNSGPSPYWTPKKGTWVTESGVYRETTGAAHPNPGSWAYLDLPLTLTAFAMSVDVNQISDGGIMLRCDETGQNYVVLITGGFGHTGTGLYWHKIKDGYNDGGVYSRVDGLFTNGVSNATITVEVRGSTYLAYVNDDPTPVTTFVWDGVSSGSIALYSWSDQTFDNIEIWTPVGTGFQYRPISFACNSYNQGRDVNYPQGQVTLGGIPFDIPVNPPHNNTWDSNAGGGAGTRTLDIPVNIKDVREVHTLINTSWGSAGMQLTTLDFHFSGGTVVRRTLIDGTDIRDWWNGGWANTVSQPTVQVYGGTGTPSPHLPTRVDKQVFTFYEPEYQNRVLEKIVITDNGSEGSHRAFLYGVTVAAEEARSTRAANMLLLE